MSPELKELLSPVNKIHVPLPKSQTALQSNPKLTRNPDPGITSSPFLTSSSPESHMGPGARRALHLVQSEFRCFQAFHLPGHWSESPMSGHVSWSGHDQAQLLHYRLSPEIFRTQQ